MSKHLLIEMNWKEAEETIKKYNMAIIPSASLHPNGLGCPIGKEWILSHELADRVGKRTGVLVLPPVIYGYTIHHSSFPGTINIPRSIVTDTFIEICRSLHKFGVTKIIYIPTHGGNNPAIEEAAFYCRNEWNMLSAALSAGVWKTLLPDLAKKLGQGQGEGMTDALSEMLYLRPDLANPSRETFEVVKQTFGDKIELIEHSSAIFKGAKVALFSRSRDISDTCGWGTPKEDCDYSKESSAEIGELIINTAVDYMVDFIEEFKKIKIPPPY